MASACRRDDKVDLILRQAGQVYGLEVKSFYNRAAYKKALSQAAAYGQQRKVPRMGLVLFIEAIDSTNRAKYEVVYVDQKTRVEVIPVFVQIGT